MSLSASNPPCLITETDALADPEGSLMGEAGQIRFFFINVKKGPVGVVVGSEKSWEVGLLGQG
jgi:hypothetical protein